MPEYVAPKQGSKAFTCPHCGTLAQQAWNNVVFVANHVDLSVSRCEVCGRNSVFDRRRTANINAWILVYPEDNIAPPPNGDLPPDVLADYEEAANIVTRSPRGAAALLRVALQKLCKALGKPGKDINADIASLVDDGLSPVIQQAMDTLRISGNESVHPGEINLNDDEELALSLFDFVNLIAEDRITTPKRVQEMYERMPEAKRKAVEQRDA
jgi:hypothetical protein